MFEGILVGVLGTLMGLILGIGICYIQIEYKIYSLDPGKYIIDAIPIELRSLDVITVAIASLLLTFLASLYPSRKAAKVNIIESIKYE